MTPAQALATIADRVDAYERKTQEAEYTDTGEVWELLYELRTIAHKAIRTKPPLMQMPLEID